MGLAGHRIHVAGSASKSVPRDRLRGAHAFVSALTRGVLEAGAEFVLFGSNEPRLDPDDAASTQVFDWTVLDEVHSAAVADRHARRLATVVTSTRSLSGRVTEERRRKLAELLECGSAAAMIIPEEHHVGGHIRRTIAGLSSALVAVGGGKGVNDLQRTFAELRRPVLPLGIEIGAACEDGTGAVGLYRRAVAAPETFFMRAPEKLRAFLLARGMANGPEEPGASAAAAVRLLDEELAGVDLNASSREVDVLAVAVLPVELQALLRVFGLGGRGSRTEFGTRFWTGHVERDGGRPYSVAVAAVGTAGNVPTAAAVTDLQRELSPSLVVLSGIAGGKQGKYRIGEVVIADMVVSYEPAALVDMPARQVPRPTAIPIAFALQQDVTAYVAGDPATRLSDAYARLAVTAPGGDGVISRPTVRTATIGSGEKLVRDAEFLDRLQADVHGKIDVVEMEAGGLATACHLGEIPFLVVRGISDLANSVKGDGHHVLASMGAAIVTRDLLANAIELAERRRG